MITFKNYKLNKIIDVHPEDAFYEDKFKIVGHTGLFCDDGRLEDDYRTGDFAFIGKSPLSDQRIYFLGVKVRELK